MHGLPDILAHNLDVVICGSSVAPDSAARGHYYANRNNSFWRLLHETGLTPHRLTPADDGSLLQYGIGLTDLAKNTVEGDDRLLNPSDFDVAGLMDKLEKYRPRWLALHGIGLVGGVVAAALGQHRPKKGVQIWNAGPSRVFVLPQSSGRSSAPRGPTWAEMARIVREEAVIQRPQPQIPGPAAFTEVGPTSTGDGLVTPDQLATELNESPSTIRRWMRTQAWRTHAEKGAPWRLKPEHIDAVRNHFSS